MPKPKSALEPGATELSQLDKFKAAAREIGTDDDPERFKAMVKRVGGAKPTDTPRGQSRPKPR